MSSSWTTEDVAYLVNYMDYCLKNTLSYHHGIEHAASKFSKRKLTLSAIDNKLRRFLLKYKISISVPVFIKTGTKHLELEHLPRVLLLAMQEQRAELGLEDLVVGRDGAMEANQDAEASEGTVEQAVSDMVPHDERIEIVQHSKTPQVEINEPSYDETFPNLTGKLLPANRGALKKPSSREQTVPELLHATEAGRKAKRKMNMDLTGLAVRRPSVPPSLIGMLPPSKRRACNTTSWHETTPLERHQATEAREVEHREMIKLLTGPAIEDISGYPGFPKVPDPAELDQHWKDLRGGIKSAVYRNFRDPNSRHFWKPVPSPEDSISLAALIDVLVVGNVVTDLRQGDVLVEGIAPYLASPHSVQALMGALLCRWLFEVPDPVCATLYHQKEKAQLQALLRGHPPSLAQRHDKIGACIVFADEQFIKDNTEKHVEVLLSKLTSAITAALPGATGFQNMMNSPQEWLREAIRLRQTLMISPKDYRVHCCRPGMLFDPTWMQAEDNQQFSITDREAKGETISTCLFPALFEAEPVTWDAEPDLDDVLVINKRFLPTDKEKRELDLKKVISKAVVLVCVRDNRNYNRIMSE